MDTPAHIALITDLIAAARTNLVPPPPPITVHAAPGATVIIYAQPPAPESQPTAAKSA